MRPLGEMGLSLHLSPPSENGPLTKGRIAEKSFNVLTLVLQVSLHFFFKVNISCLPSVNSYALADRRLVWTFWEVTDQIERWGGSLYLGRRPRFTRCTGKERRSAPFTWVSFSNAA